MRKNIYSLKEKKKAMNAPCARLQNAINVFDESFRIGNPFWTIIETRVLPECERKVDALLLFRETVNNGSAALPKRLAWKAMRGEKRVIDFCLTLVRIRNQLTKAEQLSESFRACLDEAERTLNQKEAALSEQKVTDLVEQMRAGINNWRNARTVGSKRIVSLSQDLKNSFSLFFLARK